MLSGFLAGALGLFGGAQRWINAETGKAVCIAIVSVSVLLGCVLIFRAGGTGREATVNWRWLQRITAANLKTAERQAADQKAIAEASSAAEIKALAELRAALESKADLERELAKLKDNPIVYTRDERRRLFAR